MSPTITIIIGALLLIVGLAIVFRLLKAVARMVFTLVLVVLFAVGIWYFQEPLLAFYHQLRGAL